MKRFLPYILILTIIVQLFAPFSVGLGRNNNVGVQSNQAEAEEGITVKTTAAASSKTITATATVSWALNNWRTEGDHVLLTLVDSTGKLVVDSGTMKVIKTETDPVTGFVTQTGSFTFGLDSKHPLTPDTQYGIKTAASQSVTTWWQEIQNALAASQGNILLMANPEPSTTTMSDPDPFPVKTLTEGDQEVAVAGEQTSINDTSILPVCSFSSWSVGSCVGVFIYRAIFQPSAYLFAITGKLLDYTFYYTIQDTSYRSQFVVEGWKTVRDFCNMFFIFILLYIAFGTILKINGVKTKDMIVNVVIIGLLINFSLFATQIMIDASNILARVFYNQILIGAKDKNNNIVEELGFGGSKQLTVAIVNKINPQKLIINAKKASSIPIKGAVNTNSDVATGQVDSGSFIMIAIMASIMNIVGLYVFFMVSVVFIARVIGLWLAMVLVPIAFFSYTIPQMQDVEMVGWKRWWPETLKLAFLAPVFIMFLYLIIKFLDTGLGVLNADGKDGLDFFISIIVPFAFLMVLLLKAKDITTKMSGKIGESLTGVAKSVGGFAVGAGLGLATGGAAMAMRGTLGRVGNAIANNKGLAEKEAKGGPKGWMAGRLRDFGTSAGKTSFDVRATKLGALAGKTAGVDMGKPKEGGFTKYKTEQKENRKKRADELKQAGTHEEKNDVLDKQKELDIVQTDQSIQNNIKTATVGVTNAEKDLTVAEKDLKDIIDVYGKTSWQADTARTERNDKFAAVGVAKDNLKLAEKPIKDAEANLKVSQNALANAQRNIVRDYAGSIQDGWTNTINTITSLGQQSAGANKQAAREMLANMPQDKK